MAAPDSLTISKVGTDNQNRQKIKLEGQGETSFGIFDPDDQLSAVAEGVQFKGWVNHEGQYGPYVRVAKALSGQTTNGAEAQTSGGGGSREISIERQVAAKCAAEIVASWRAPISDQAKAAEMVHFLVDTFYDAIHASTGPAAVPPTATSDDESIPF